MHIAADLSQGLVRGYPNTTMGFPYSVIFWSLLAVCGHAGSSGLSDMEIASAITTSPVMLPKQALKVCVEHR